jgi:hypothetical protein
MQPSYRALYARKVGGACDERRCADGERLSTDLFIEGWRSVDRRLGRLEKMIERIDRRQQFDGGNGAGAEVHRLEDRNGSSRA